MKLFLTVLLLAVCTYGQERREAFSFGPDSNPDLRIWSCMYGPYHVELPDGHPFCDIAPGEKICMMGRSSVHLWILGNYLYVVNDEGYVDRMGQVAKEKEENNVLTFMNGVH